MLLLIEERRRPLNLQQAPAQAEAKAEGEAEGEAAEGGGAPGRPNGSKGAPRPLVAHKNAKASAPRGAPRRRHPRRRARARAPLRRRALPLTRRRPGRLRRANGSNARGRVVPAAAGVWGDACRGAGRRTVARGE